MDWKTTHITPGKRKQFEKSGDPDKRQGSAVQKGASGFIGN
jgi:hypothetical protein